MKELTQDELVQIQGGSFWEDAAYVIGYTLSAAHSIANQLRDNSSYGNANVYK